ncbi:MAG: hypothetical protein J6J36_07680 [Clostridia bacterium]|nr:hypothetical protein [Clostridia bacterium]
MKVNKRKIILLVLFIFLILPSFITKTCANTIDLSEKGSITITLKEKKEIENAEITIYKIANAKIENNNLTYVYSDEFTDYDVEVNKLDNIEAVKNLIQYISKNNVKGTIASTNNNGEVNFKDLSTGLYLVVETKGVTGYYNINPFIISIPDEENGEWIYNISSTPKVKAMANPQGKPPVSEPDDNPNEDNSVIDEGDKPNDKNTQDENNEIASSNNEVNQNIGNQLIKTGQDIWPIVIFSVLGIICIIIGIAITLRRKKNEE